MFWESIKSLREWRTSWEDHGTGKGISQGGNKEVKGSPKDHFGPFYVILITRIVFVEKWALLKEK